MISKHAHRRLMDLLAGASHYADGCAESAKEKIIKGSPKRYRKEAFQLTDLYQRVGAVDNPSENQIDIWLQELMNLIKE